VAGFDRALFFALAARDRVNAIHSSKVANYIVRLAKTWGLTEKEVSTFYQAGLLHDIGKIGISDRLLQSREKYTRADWEEMKQHVRIGGMLLKSLGFAEEIVMSALYHHERFDGGGYLYGLAGEEIPLVARMIAVADAFEALTGYRLYRRPVEPGRAFEIMAESRGQFDPAVFGVFRSMWEAETAARARSRPRRLKKVRASGPRPPVPRFRSGTGQRSLKVVVIGVSSGGPRTLVDILPYLPQDLPAAVLVVQHMPENFTASFAQRLDQCCRMAVKEAADGDELTPGKILVAKGGYHLKIKKNAGGGLAVRLSRQPANVLYIPSVNVTMQSVLEKVPPRNVVGVLLTGMGDDGADMMVEIRKQGGYTIAEAKETAVVWGMPREAYLRGGAEVVAPSHLIAEQIVKGVRRD